MRIPNGPIAAAAACAGGDYRQMGLDRPLYEVPLPRRLPAPTATTARTEGDAGTKIGPDPYPAVTRRPAGPSPR